MEQLKLIKFKAEIHIIGINPFVFLPKLQLKQLFEQAEKDKGKIPVNIKIDGYAFKQTLVKYAGEWRLYLNKPMRKAVCKDIGDVATFEISFDTDERGIVIHPNLDKALKENIKAQIIFNDLAPYLQKEIIRYINNLKNEDSVDKNVKRAIQFLLGKERFIGREHP